MDKVSLGHAFQVPEQDSRKLRRTQKLTSGFLANAADLIIADCFIRNITAEGAEIRIDEDQPIPDEMYLVDLRSHSAYRTRCVWRRASLVGLAFEAEYRLEGEVPADIEFLRGLFHLEKLRHDAEASALGGRLDDALADVGVT